MATVPAVGKSIVDLIAEQQLMDELQKQQAQQPVYGPTVDNALLLEIERAKAAQHTPGALDWMSAADKMADNLLNPKSGTNVLEMIKSYAEEAAPWALYNLTPAGQALTSSRDIAATVQNPELSIGQKILQAAPEAMNMALSIDPIPEHLGGLMAQGIERGKGFVDELAPIAARTIANERGAIGPADPPESAKAKLAGTRIVGGDIESVDELMSMLNSQDVYVRWSRSPEKDIERGYSIDHGTGTRHEGLSALKVRGKFEDAIHDIASYRMIGMGDKKSKPHLFTGKLTGTDTDDAELISDPAHLGTIGPRLMKDINAAINIDRYITRKANKWHVTDIELNEASRSLGELMSSSSLPVDYVDRLIQRARAAGLTPQSALSPGGKTGKLISDAQIKKAKK